MDGMDPAMLQNMMKMFGGGGGDGAPDMGSMLQNMMGGMGNNEKDKKTFKTIQEVAEKLKEEMDKKPPSQDNINGILQDNEKFFTQASKEMAERQKKELEDKIREMKEKNPYDENIAHVDSMLKANQEYLSKLDNIQKGEQVQKLGNNYWAKHLYESGLRAEADWMGKLKNALGIDENGSFMEVGKKMMGFMKDFLGDKMGSGVKEGEKPDGTKRIMTIPPGIVTSVTAFMFLAPIVGPQIMLIIWPLSVLKTIHGAISADAIAHNTMNSIIGDVLFEIDNKEATKETIKKVQKEIGLLLEEAMKAEPNGEKIDRFLSSLQGEKVGAQEIVKILNNFIEYTHNEKKLSLRQEQSLADKDVTPSHVGNQLEGKESVNEEAVKVAQAIAGAGVGEQKHGKEELDIRGVLQGKSKFSLPDDSGIPEDTSSTTLPSKPIPGHVSKNSGEQESQLG